MALFGGGGIAGDGGISPWGQRNSPYDPRRPQTPAGTPGGNLYNRSVEQGAEDYSSIMKGYKDLLARSQSPSGDYVSSMANLKDLSTTGGYSPEAQANIRARGISPIRAAYATAQRNIDRQKNLQGGYSPNYGALQAKLAREMSSTMSDQTANVEAEIADRVARGRLGVAGTYASAAQNVNQPQVEALRGMTSLYGTTPANAALFGDQAMRAAQMESQAQQQNEARRANVYRGFGYGGA